MAFEATGGSIGRAADNDWVLPDPQRFVSAHHARIHYRDGLYILEDTSTNGVYINDDAHPVSKRGAHVLQNGDIVRFGEYQAVAIVESPTATGSAAADAGPDDLSGVFAAAVTSSVPVHDAPVNIDAVAAIGQVAQTDLGASLNLDELLQPDEWDTKGPQPGANAYGTPAPPLTFALDRPAAGLTVPVRSSPTPTELSAALADSETERRSIARRIERLARAASRAQERRTALSPPSIPDANSGLAAFCKGAGVAADNFAPELQTHVLHLAGQLLREALVGLKDLERLRRESLRPLQIDLPADPDDPRPSLARAGVEDLLVELFSQNESRRLDAVQWLREVIDRAKAHDRATFVALREAFRDFVARLEPGELEARFARHGRGTRGDPARNWELYTEFFRSIAARTDDQLPRVFLDAFGIAYGGDQPALGADPGLPRER